jgi:hypothetical protein
MDSRLRGNDVRRARAAMKGSTVRVASDAHTSTGKRQFLALIQTIIAHMRWLSLQY